MAVVGNYGSARLPDGRRFEGWANGVAFDSYTVSADGASFELFPVRGLHSTSDVAEAKRQIRNARDAVSFYATWQAEGSVVPKPPEGNDAVAERPAAGPAGAESGSPGGA